MQPDNDLYEKTLAQYPGCESPKLVQKVLPLSSIPDQRGRLVLLGPFRQVFRVHGDTDGNLVFTAEVDAELAKEHLKKWDVHLSHPEKETRSEPAEMGAQFYVYRLGDSLPPASKLVCIGAVGDLYFFTGEPHGLFSSLFSF